MTRPVSDVAKVRFGGGERSGPWIWLGLAAVVLAPVFVGTHQGLGLLSQIGIALVACLSYQLLLGEGGLLSFGHAIHTGLGAYAAMHALHAVSYTHLTLPTKRIV